MAVACFNEPLEKFAKFRKTGQIGNCSACGVHLCTRCMVEHIL